MKLKSLVFLVLVLALTVALGVLLSSCGKPADKVIYVYNWGEYIADGSDGCIDLIDEFEKATGYTVVYDNFDSNESMYAMLKSGAAQYDVIIPSDYMIEQLIAEDMLQKINTENIPNYQYVDPQYKGLYFDPNDEYSVPYNVGMTGIIYNTAMVDEEDAAKQSIELLFDPKYTGNILTYDNHRDGFAMAQIALGLDFNSPYKKDWDAAFDKMVAQSAVLQGYVMDKIYAKMEGGNAAIGAYYAGDCLSMMDENEDLAFYYPTEGANVFVDSMCIPKNARNVAGAEAFINFVLDPEIGEGNALFLYYVSPNLAVQQSESYQEELGEDCYNLLYVYPESYLGDDGKLDDSIAQWYHNLGSVRLLLDDGTDAGKTVLEYLSELWTQVKMK